MVYFTRGHLGQVLKKFSEIWSKMEGMWCNTVVDTCPDLTCQSALRCPLELRLVPALLELEEWLEMVDCKWYKPASTFPINKIELSVWCDKVQWFLLLILEDTTLTFWPTK